MLYTLYILLHWEKVQWLLTAPRVKSQTLITVCLSGQPASCLPFPLQLPGTKLPSARQMVPSVPGPSPDFPSSFPFMVLPGEPFHYSPGCGFVPLAGSSRHFLTFRPPSNPSPELLSAYLSAVITQTPGSPQPSLFVWLFYLKMTAT